MSVWLNKIKSCFSKKEFILGLVVGLLFLLISLYINYYAGIYATKSASNSVTDIVLSNIRVYDVDGIFVNGAIVFWIFAILVMLYEPKRIPFTIKAISLFVVIRSVFISLTHIGPFPTEVVLTGSKVMQKFAFGGDLFFSGHTGLPFLMALIFWRNAYLRWIFLLSSVMFAVVVLLAHLHYSIDVLSAFFITYTIYHMALFFFRKDHALFLADHVL